MECLLPSEIARLVFGYLEDQKCDEAAQCFLEHSTFLSECLNVVRAGRKFSSRVQGSSLLDILDEYCAVQSLVAERIRKLPENSSEQLQNCGGLVEKLKILLDNAKSGQTVAVSISVLPHGGASQGNGTQGTLHNRSRAAQSAHERKRSIRFQGQEIKQKVKEREERNVSLECSVETTRLETLPGLSGQGSSRSDRALHPLPRTNESTFHISENISRTNGEEIFYSNFASEQFSSEKGRSHSFSSTSTIPDKDAGQDVNVNICDVGTSTNTCSKRKTHNKKKCTPSKSSPLRVRKSLRGDEEEEDEEEEESVAATLHRALLNNTELHEKIAENINSVIRIPNDLGSNEMSCGPIGSEDCEGVIQELNNAIKMVVDKTQEDPVFERLLEEIIGPTDEDMSSSPTGVESETDDACDAPDALLCDEDFIISKGEGNSDRNSAVVTTLSQHSLTIVSEGNQKSVVNTLVETSNVVSSLSAVPNVVSDKGKCEDREVPVTLNNVDENIQANSELLPISNKSLRVNVEKLSKKSCQQASQTKGKSSSASSNVTLQENDGSAVLSIHKEVRALLENVASDTVSTPKSDIPLKQRLRSARKSDNSLQGTTKETSSVDRSLEDQNAKAIQLILEANKKSSQLLETENIGNSNDEVSSKEVNKNSSSISPKKISDVPEKSNDNNEKEVITRDKSTREESQDAASATAQPQDAASAGSETSVDINPAEELNNALSFDNFADKPTQNSVLVEERCDIIQQTNVEKEQIMMLTIPSVMNPNTSTSSVISQSQTEQLTTRTSVASVPQTSYHETNNLQKQVMFSQQQSSEHLPSPFSVLTLSQNVNDAAEGSTKQMIMDETNSSAVIVCDSNVTFPSFQFLTGADTKENQPKKMRPIAPRPIRPKPATSAFPLQLITTDITPQYFVTQVPPTPLLERRNIIPPLSPGLLNVLNLTVPVISQTNEPIKKICICASEDCGKECVEITDKNINLVLSTVGTNSDIYGDSDISSVSEHVPDNPENETNEKVVDTAHLSTSNVCESNNNNFNGPSTSSNTNEPNQQLTTTSSKSKHNQVEIQDMSSLLLLPEQMPKPRDTPQEFIAGKSGANTRRLSLSTPRRRTSHIRALDFGTPQKSGTESLALKKSQTSPKPSSKTNIEGNGAISKVGFSTSPYKPSNKQVRSVRSSLFTSPDPPVDNKDGKKSSKENPNNSHVVPIATRSPVTHLLGDWDKATGVGLIFNGVSPENSATRKADHRPSRITPKTLLFSPESESNSASDQNQTPPSQNISDTNKNSDNDLKHTESNEPMKSLPDIGTKNKDLNILGQKVSPNTMSIKQKLKSRSWDEDLRMLLSKDFEDVYVQRNSLGKDTRSSVLKNKGTGKSSKKDQATKKLKKRNVKKTNRKNTLDDEVCSALNASELKYKQLNSAGPEEKEVDSTNNQDNASSSQNYNECANLQTEKDKSPVEEHKNNCSDAPSDIKSNNVSRKRKADEKPENCVPKRPKPASKEENGVGKTVEEVLESMFCEDNGNSSDKDARPKEKETNKFENKTRDVLVVLNSTQDNVTETSKALLQTETRDNSNRSIFDLEDSGEDTQRALRKSAEPEISCKATKVNCDVIKDNLVTESSQLPVNRTAVTTQTSQSLEKSSKITEQNNSLNASKKAGTNLEKNIHLETPIKNDMKCLSKNFNPTTPGPVDGLFPMTPRVLSPSHQEETPMTKLLRSEPCMNFSMIVTPSLPPTPNIMISPCSENQDSPTSYASRPTDYSSCSSYYNPSKSIDTPTKLEQELIKECNKIEQSKKKAQDKLDKRKENLESISRNIAVDAKTSQDKKAETESADFPKEVQSQLKDISTSQEENEPLNSNSSCFVTVSCAEEVETSNTEKISSLLGQNIKVGQKDVEKTMKQASLEIILGEKNCFTTNLGQKKTVNAQNKLGEKVALRGQICPEGNKKVKDLSVQMEEVLSKENKVEIGLKTSESKSMDEPILRFNDQSPCHTKDPEVSEEISVIQNSEKIPFQNEPIKSILQNALEKGKGTLMKNKNTFKDPSISQDVHCEKSLCATSEEISKHCEVGILGGEADCDSTVEELINENHSHDSNTQSNSEMGPSKTLNTSSREAKNDTQKNMFTRASAKREIGTIKHSTEMVSEIKEQFSKNEIKKKGKKSAQTQEKLSHYSTTNASDSSCPSNENERNNVTGNADNENVAALKAQKIKNVSNVQINSKNNTGKIKNNHSNLQGTISVPAKKTGRKTMEDVDPQENKGVTSRNVTRKSIGYNSSQINKNVNKSNLVQADATNITPVKSRVERQKGMKRTPKVTEMVRYFVSKTPSKSPRSQALKSKNLLKKRIVHKESGIKKNTKPEDILSEKNGNPIRKKLNKVNKDSTIELRNETEECEKRKDEKSSKKENEFVKSDRNSEKNEKSECIEITDRKNENENVIHINETETAHQENEKVDTISDDEPSEKGEEVDSKTEDKRSDEERRELQIQKNESVIDVHIHYDEVRGLHQEETMVSHKCESVNMNTEINLESLSSRTNTVFGGSEDIEKEQLESRCSEKENITTSVNNKNNNTSNTNRQVNCISASEGTTSIEISQNDSTEVLKVSGIEQLPIKPSAILGSESSKQIDFSASVEVDYERQEETETSSSESDSDESSENSSSDSSDESSIDTSQSQDSFVERSDKETGLQEGNSTSLRDVTGDDILSSENQLTCEKEGQQPVEESCSETINEILKTTSSVSYIRQDMCFASELCEKKKRTLAKLKGSTEIGQTLKNTNNTANKDGEISEVSVCHQPVRCEQNQVSRERRVEERNWDESSIEEFPVLHLSDSESAGNATPILSPIKSLLMDDDFERQKNNTTKRNAISREISLKRIHSPAKDAIAHAVKRFSTESFEKNCANDGELKVDREVVPESELHKNKNDFPVIEGCSVPNPFEPENTNCRDSESTVSVGDSIVESVMRMNENELFLKILYTGNFCPTPQAVNHTNFCYSLNEDDNEITIIGSQFQSLMEIPSKEICDKPNCTKHVKEQEIESTSSMTKTYSSIEGKIDSQEFGDSISDSTISIEGNNKQSIKQSSKLRPLDALYEEMIRCNDSSSMSDETDVFMEKSSKSKELSTVKCTKKKTTGSGKSHQGSLKVSGSGERLLQESMRYQSPLEMISEYKYEKEERSSNYSIRSDSKIKDQSKTKKEANQSERKDKGELEEGEILDSPPKESTSSGSKARRDSSRYVYRSSYRRSESSDGSLHSYSSHRSKPRSSETAKRETYSHHHKNEKHQTSTVSSHHDDVRSLPPKKRKAISDETIKESEKRVRHDNPCRLLKNLNIDSFLNKVHGEDPCK